MVPESCAILTALGTHQEIRDAAFPPVTAPVLPVGWSIVHQRDTGIVAHVKCRADVSLTGQMPADLQDLRAMRNRASVAVSSTR